VSTLYCAVDYPMSTVYCAVDHPVSTFTIPLCNVLQTASFTNADSCAVYILWTGNAFCKRWISLYQHAAVSLVGVWIFIVFIVFCLSFYSGLSHVSWQVGRKAVVAYFLGVLRKTVKHTGIMVSQWWEYRCDGYGSRTAKQLCRFLP